MKGIIAVAALFASLPTQGQGVVQFNNRIPPNLIARVVFFDGTPVSSGFTAQLYGGPTGTPVHQLTPLFPTTTFRPGNAAGFVVPVEVVVPGVPADGSATFIMRVFNGETFETSTRLGESIPITVRNLGGVTSSGGPPLTPPTLQGLQGFIVDIPEPATLVLSVVGAAFLFLRRRTGSRQQGRV